MPVNVPRRPHAAGSMVAIAMDPNNFIEVGWIRQRNTTCLGPYTNFYSAYRKNSEPPVFRVIGPATPGRDHSFIVQWSPSDNKWRVMIDGRLIATINLPFSSGQATSQMEDSTGRLHHPAGTQVAYWWSLKYYQEYRPDRYRWVDWVDSLPYVELAFNARIEKISDTSYRVWST